MAAMDIAAVPYWLGQGLLGRLRPDGPRFHSRRVSCAGASLRKHGRRSRAVAARSCGASRCFARGS